jgi:RNA-directed DNA polymerase
VILSEDRDWLVRLLMQIGEYLRDDFKLALHPQKVSITTFASGVDFLGWVHFPHHRQIRTATKCRLTRRLEGSPKKETVASYVGLLRHGDTYELRREVGLADESFCK